MKHLLMFALIVVVASAVAQIGSTKVALPADPGMYVQDGNGFTKIIGQIAEFRRTGSRFVSSATVGIKSAKENIQLPGPHAQTNASPQPVFYFIPPKQEAAAGVNAGDFILIRLEEKPHRRQFEIGAAGLFRASAGISLTHQIQILRSEAAPGVYMITPAVELDKGEYALYLARGEGLAAYVYDFGVQGARSTHTLHATDQRPATNFPGLTADSGNDPVVPRPTTSPQTVTAPASAPAAVSTATHGGVLGVGGADWEQGDSRGVEIVEVADNSAAQLAGLRKGYVITDVNGTHIRSTQDLANVLAQTEPGTRVSIAYLSKSGLGWMPQETVAILGK
jgi:hypothetical protein